MTSIEDQEFEQFMRDGDKLRELESQLNLTKLERPIYSPFSDRVIKPLRLTPAELRQLQAEIWQAKMNILQYCKRDQIRRFGKPDDWVDEAIKRQQALFWGDSQVQHD